MMVAWLVQRFTKKVAWAMRTYYVEEGELTFSDLNKARLDEIISTADITFKNDATTDVVQYDLDGKEYILKRYNARSLWHVFSRAIRRSRASRCWNMSYKFANAGLNVAQPMLMYEQRFGPFCRNAYFLNKKLSGAELLNAFPTMPEDQQQSVVSQIKSAFEKMHQAKLTHGDMKASNLIWSDGKLFFIDLDAARQHTNLWSWRKSHAKDRKRFLKNWQGSPQLLALFDEL